MKAITPNSLFPFLLLIFFACESNEIPPTKEDIHPSIIKTSFEDALKKPEQVSSILLSKKGIQKIPVTIDRRFTHLLHLKLDQNNIRSIPESIGELPYLMSLHLGFNQLSSVPKFLTNKKNLGSVDLSL